MESFCETRLDLRYGSNVPSELEDIDWNLGQVNVRGKSGQRNPLPLPTEVGQAIASRTRTLRASLMGQPVSSKNLMSR